MAKFSKREMTLAEMNKSISVNSNAKLKIPTRSYTEEKQYKCTCCGKSWDNRKGHFSKSMHIKYQSNDNYIEICNDCRDSYYRQLVNFFDGNETHAIKMMCQEFGWIYHIDAVTASKQISADRSRISHYLAKKNLNPVNLIGSTYLDGLRYDFETREEIIESKEQIQNSFENAISENAIDRWGVGFTELDYKNLDEHYKMLKKNNPNCDNNQEIFVKSLCNINMLMVRALKDGNSDQYVKLTEQYAKTFKQAGLKTVEEKDSSNDDVFGVTLAVISKYTPEEFYQDKELYKDYCGLGEYYDRHVCRPMKNLMMNSDERDYEFFVPDNTNDVDE